VSPREAPRPPDLPAELATAAPPGSDGHGALNLSGARLHADAGEALALARLHVEESELHGLALEAGKVPGLVLSDVILRGCDLSNVHAGEGSIRRGEIRDSRLVGFALNEGKLADLHVLDTTLAYASLAHSQLRRVLFERVILREASFLEATLAAVEFVACELAGADFRGARLSDCVIRGSSLEGVIGVESLGGLTMPWEDLVGSTAALASALGIAVEPDP
jgi:uncharacterized protein YjbI with pentapeptide repeats